MNTLLRKASKNDIIIWEESGEIDWKRLESPEAQILFSKLREHYKKVSE